MKTHVISDIHGCLQELEALLVKVNPNLAEDRLVIAGDMVDRGENSAGVVHLLRKLQKTYGHQQVVVLRGNHEQMLLDRHDFPYGHSCTTGNTITGSRAIRHEGMRLDDLAWFSLLPLTYEGDGLVVVHAGFRPGIPLQKQEQEDMLWIRDEFYRSGWNGDRRIVFGHTPTQHLHGRSEPWIHGQLIGIDTGCAYGFALSALTLENGEVSDIHQVKAIGCPTHAVSCVR